MAVSGNVMDPRLCVEWIVRRKIESVIGAPIELRSNGISFIQLKLGLAKS